MEPSKLATHSNWLAIRCRMSQIIWGSVGSDSDGYLQSALLTNHIRIPKLHSTGSRSLPSYEVAGYCKCMPNPLTMLRHIERTCVNKYRGEVEKLETTLVGRRPRYCRHVRNTLSYGMVTMTSWRLITSSAEEACHLGTKCRFWCRMGVGGAEGGRRERGYASRILIVC